MGVASPVSEILLVFVCLQNGGQKIELALKFMQVEVHVKCMQTNFGGHDLSGFGDIVTLKNGQIFLSDHRL